MPVLVVLEALLNLGDQFGQVVPLHVVALRVEVEPGIPDLLIVEVFDHFVEVFADNLLRAFLVNEVDQVVFSIYLLYLVEVVHRHVLQLHHVCLD